MYSKNVHNNKYKGNTSGDKVMGTSLNMGKFTLYLQKLQDDNVWAADTQHHGPGPGFTRIYRQDLKCWLVTNMCVRQCGVKVQTHLINTAPARP